LGKAHEGREIVMLIAASNQEFTPEKQNYREKISYLFRHVFMPVTQDGKDAGFL
jgi:hypothetical protein